MRLYKHPSHHRHSFTQPSYFNNNMASRTTHDFFDSIKYEHSFKTEVASMLPLRVYRTFRAKTWKQFAEEMQKARDTMKADGILPHDYDISSHSIDDEDIIVSPALLRLCHLNGFRHFGMSNLFEKVLLRWVCSQIHFGVTMTTDLSDVTSTHFQTEELGYIMNIPGQTRPCSDWPVSCPPLYFGLKLNMLPRIAIKLSDEDEYLPIEACRSVVAKFTDIKLYQLMRHVSRGSIDVRRPVGGGIILRLEGVVSGCR